MPAAGEVQGACLLGGHTRFRVVALLSSERCDTIAIVPLRQYPRCVIGGAAPIHLRKLRGAGAGRQPPASSWAAARTRAGVAAHWHWRCALADARLPGALRAIEQGALPGLDFGSGQGKNRRTDFN
jgi:hypothetical protein